MRIVLLEPDGQTKRGVVTSMRGLRDEFPRVSFAGEPTNTQLEELLLPALVSAETEPPAVAEGERAVSTDVRQEDGTWLQVWGIEPIMTLEHAKAQLAVAAVELYWNKVVVAVPAVPELTNFNADPAAIMADRVTRFRPKLVQVRNAIQVATSVQEIFTLYRQLQDAT